MQQQRQHQCNENHIRKYRKNETENYKMNVDEPKKRFQWTGKNANKKSI